ncbi:MAG: FMN phosphatase YigB (HAD superfamily) [Parvicellaceae bacterium]|jgi:FMN phosphatase YigB (HAD superfamily)
MSIYEIEPAREEKKVLTFFNSSDIRLIVFDLHGTLTTRTSIHPYHIEYRNQYLEKILGYSLPEHFSVGTDEAFGLFPALNKYDFYKHRDNDPLFEFERIHAPNQQLVEKLMAISKHFYTVLYTDSYLKQIERTLSAIGICNIFDSIIGMENGHRKVSSQFTIYPDLCSGLSIKIENVLIVGDRMDKDINPVLQAGGNAIKIESSAFIMEALEIINKTFASKELICIKTQFSRNRVDQSPSLSI